MNWINLSGRTMFRDIYILLFFVSTCHFGLTQEIYYQDCFNGNVCVLGVNSWDITHVNLYDQGSQQIRRAFLVSGAQIDNVLPNANYAQSVFIDGNLFTLNNGTRCTNRFEALLLRDGGYVHVIDVTTAITSSNFEIYAQPISLPIGEDPNPKYYGMSLVVLYDNPLKSQVCFSMWLNDVDVSVENYFSYTDVLSIDSSSSVGLSFSLGHMMSCSGEDGSYVYLNELPIGLICGPDECYSPAGTAGAIQGQFYFDNGLLTGICDDDEDALMVGTDVLSNIQTYLSFGATEFDVRMIYQKENATVYEGSSNPCWATFLAYTSPCDTFSVSISDNLNICKGQQAQLQAKGGNAYVWQPQVDLSCYDCPNPVFIGDTSRFYTCRIWNTDSCSKVLPVKVNVLSNPIVPTFTIAPTECYGHTGEIEITASPVGFTYAINGGVPQSQTLFEGLQEGYHVLTAIDNNGCESDTAIYINEVNSTVAQFTVSPQSGNVPLEVSLNNQSQHATHYVWYIGNDTIQTTSTAPFTHTFNTEGNFDIALVAYHTTEECSDTTYKNVLSEFPFRVIVPTLYGGYADGSPYRIYTSGLSSLQFKLYSNDGRLVHIAELNPTAGHITLWESTDIASGLYIYHIRAIAEDGTEKMITGKLVVV